VLLVKIVQSSFVTLLYFPDYFAVFHYAGL
jgi:hypothetical protein